MLTLPTVLDVLVQVHLAPILPNFQNAVAVGIPRMALCPALALGAKSVGVRISPALDGRTLIRVRALPSDAVHELIRFRLGAVAPTLATVRNITL